MPKDKEIENLEQLKTEYQNAKADAEKHIRSDMKRFAEITKALPSVVAEATARGISNKIADIDQGFSDIDFAEIESELALGTLTGIKENSNEKWAKDNADRSKVVTGTVTNAKNKVTNMKSKMAKGAIKVTSVIGKGLVLFGQKGLAKSMNKAVAEKGEAFVSKDSRIGKIMEKVAEGGFTVADNARNVAQTVKKGAKRTVETVEGGVKSAARTVTTKAKNAKTSIENEIKDRKQAFHDAGSRTELDQMSIARERANKNRENDEWQQVYDDRSEVVTDKVKEINEKSVNRRSKAALRDIKITGMVAKGVALFGPKGLAEKMQDSVYKSSAKRIERDSISSKIAKTAAEKGFSVSTKFKESLAHAKEKVGEIKDNTVSKVKDTIDDGKKLVKKGALEFGKKTYKGAAVIGALGSIGLGAIKTGAGKVVDGVEFVADKVEDGADIVAGKIEDSVDHAKDYKTVAMAKLSKQKSAISKGFKGFLQGMAQGVVDKLTPSIDKDQKNIDAQEQIIEGVKNKGKETQEPKMQEATDDGR